MSSRSWWSLVRTLTVCFGETVATDRRQQGGRVVQGELEPTGPLPASSVGGHLQDGLS
jgi:hypothetical protein